MANSPTKVRQAGADIQISLGANYVGGKLICDLINDPQFMATPNWSGELAARVYRAMVAQAVHEGRLAILEEPELQSEPHRQFSALVPRSAQHSETREMAD